MARYDSAFLVPYLRDICTLYLAKRETEVLIYEAREEIEQIEQNALSKVGPTDLEAYCGQKDLQGAGCGYASCGLFCWLLGAGATFWGDIEGFWVGLLLAFIGLGLIFYSFGERDRVNAKIYDRNIEKEMEHAERKTIALLIAQPEIDAVEEQISYYEKEIDHINTVLQELYSANVIPRWYRNLYPAVYLDDWFSNGRSGDLDMALNTFVLEQIKDKLDIIIHNQSEELLHQRIMIANQFTAMDQQERHRREWMNKLDQMQCDDEVRNTYLKMMNANMAANTYFSGANYLKK